MRKVFFSTVKNARDSEQSKVKSRDFDLGGKAFCAPIAYVLDANIEAGDDILIITTVGEAKNPQDNFKELKNDFDKILASHGAKAVFAEIVEPNPRKRLDEMDSLTFSRYFRELSDYFEDGDRIYADMTFGMKCNTICSLTAISYAVKAGKDIDVERMVYQEKYDGKEDSGEPPASYIVDITSIFYISTLIHNAHPGQKKSIDSFLKFMIG